MSLIKLDDYTGFTLTLLLDHKKEIFKAFVIFTKDSQNQFSFKWMFKLHEGTKNDEIWITVSLEGWL